MEKVKILNLRNNDGVKAVTFDHDKGFHFDLIYEPEYILAIPNHDIFISLRQEAFTRENLRNLIENHTKNMLWGPYDTEAILTAIFDI